MSSEYFDSLPHAQPDPAQPIVEVYYKRPDDVMTHISLHQSRIPLLSLIKYAMTK